MDTARTAVLIIFGLCAGLAYAPLLIVSYLYIIEDDKPLAYASGVGALICIVACAWVIELIWRQDRNEKHEHERERQDRPAGGTDAP